jgi:hypothetical protein
MAIMKPQNLSADAQIVWDSLSVKEREAIQKGYPFIKIRDNVIRKLRMKGVNGSLIAGISGNSRSTISRAYRRQVDHDKETGREDLLKNIYSTIIEI